MNIPLAFGDYAGRARAANATEMINMMTELDQQGGTASYYITGTPGCKAYVDPARQGEGRGGFVYPGTCLFVVGGYLYAINTNTGVITEVDTLHTNTGAVQFCENPSQVLLIDGQYGYVYSKALGTLTTVSDEDFPEPLSCTVKDGYGVVVKKSTGKMYASAINNLASWGALSFTTAEFEPDNLMGVCAGPDSLFAFGEKTVQVYYNSGDATYPFDPRVGANMQIGCGATNSIAGGHNLIFWLDNFGSVRMMTGYTPKKISTPQIDYQIGQLTSASTAVGSVYSQEGHVFYCLAFPADRKNYIYDATTEQWHRRASYRLNGRWRASWVAQDDTLVLAGDYWNGQVYQLDLGTYTDNAEAIIWRCTSQNINSDNHMLAHDELQVRVEAGTAGQSEDPQLWMQYSDNNGRSWSNEQWRSMGEVGEYEKLLRWHTLGQSRGRIYRFGGASDEKRVIVSAHLKVRDLGY